MRPPIQGLKFMTGVAGVAVCLGAAVAVLEAHVRADDLITATDHVSAPMTVAVDPAVQDILIATPQPVR